MELYFYKNGEMVDSKEEADWFEIEYTSFSSLWGSIAERSNARVLKKKLEEAGIKYKVDKYAHMGESIFIDINAIGHPLIGAIIRELDSYPVIDEDDYLELEHEYTIEYLGELAERLDYDKDDFIRVYWEVWGIGIEGVIFEPGTKPYLDKEYIETMKEVL